MVAAELPSPPALPPEAAKHVAKGTRYLTRGKRTEAQSEYELAQASRSNPSEVTHILWAIAAALRDTGRVKEALTYLERALESAPHDWQLHYARAVLLSDLDRDREAIAALDQALGLHDASELRALKRAILDEHYKKLVEEGFGLWSGKRPEGSKNPIAITQGPPVSDYVIEDRR